MSHSISTVFCLFEATQAQPCRPTTSSYSLNGTSSYAILTAQANCNTSNALTVETWIRPTAFAPTKDNGSIVCNHEWSSGEQQGFVLGRAGAGVSHFNNPGTTAGSSTGNWLEVFGPNERSLDSWQHIAGTYEGDSLKLYLNENQVISSVFSGTIANSSTAFPLSIGSLAVPFPSDRRYFTSFNEALRIWSRTLDGAELLANSINETDSLSAQGLGSYWRFNENSRTSSCNVSVNDQTAHCLQAMGFQVFTLTIWQLKRNNFS